MAFQLWHRIRGEALAGGMLSPDIDTEDADDDELADVFPPAALASRTQSRLLTLKCARLYRAPSLTNVS